MWLWVTLSSAELTSFCAISVYCWVIVSSGVFGTRDGDFITFVTSSRSILRAWSFVDEVWQSPAVVCLCRFGTMIFSEYQNKINEAFTTYCRLIGVLFLCFLFRHSLPDSVCFGTGTGCMVIVELVNVSSFRMAITDTSLSDFAITA